MFNNMREVVAAVRERYEGVERLSQANGTSYYNHGVNGVGCAIGCLVDDETAGCMDHFMAIMAWRQETREMFLRPLFGAEIPIDDVVRLQHAHDKSYSVEEFISKLDYYLAHGRWA